MIEYLCSFIVLTFPFVFAPLPPFYCLKWDVSIEVLFYCFFIAFWKKLFAFESINRSSKRVSSKNPKLLNEKNKFQIKGDQNPLTFIAFFEFDFIHLYISERFNIIKGDNFHIKMKIISKRHRFGLNTNSVVRTDITDISSKKKVFKDRLCLSLMNWHDKGWL